MSNPSGIVKRIPLIKFPNRKAGQTQGIVLRLLVLCFFFPPPPLLLCFGIGSIWFRSFCVLEMAPLSLPLSLALSLIRSCIVDAWRNGYPDFLLVEISCVSFCMAGGDDQGLVVRETSSELLCMHGREQGIPSLHLKCSACMGEEKKRLLSIWIAFQAWERRGLLRKAFIASRGIYLFNSAGGTTKINGLGQKKTTTSKHGQLLLGGSLTHIEDCSQNQNSASKLRRFSNKRFHCGGCKEYIPIGRILCWEIDRTEPTDMTLASNPV